MDSKIGVGVGAIVTRDGKLLMVRRAKDPGRTLWSIPGGHVEPGEYLTDALKREVKEETQVDVEVGDLLGILELPGEDHLIVLDYHASASSDREPIPGDDVDEARWVPFDEVADLECTPRFHETMRGWGVLPPL
ncbi:MAG: 8-oxo-dGTP diphosphatase [Actinomycetota bacterium]|jgi:ADP-ribose pyrophosphatase YjhB (NUDIX family)|nr:8-oxo-dGTP diphosphatase [Actinomycetota bacterium]